MSQPVVSMRLDAFQPRWIDVGLGIATCAHLASTGGGVAVLPVAVVSNLVSEGWLTPYDIRQEFLPWQIAAVRKRYANANVVDPVIDARVERLACSSNGAITHATFAPCVHRLVLLINLADL